MSADLSPEIILPRTGGETQVVAPIPGTPWYRLRLDMAAREVPPPQQYIVGHLPDERGVYGLLIGPDGARKSWLALHIALAVAGGRPVAGGLWTAPAGGRVVYVVAEDSAPVIWRRLHAVARQPGWEWVADLDDRLDIIPLLAGDHGLTIIQQTPGGPVRAQDVVQMVEYARGARLVILDPLADLADADDSDDRAGRMLVQTLRGISRETGAAVIGVHHQRKSSMLAGETHHQTARGSSRLGAGARWAVVLQPLSVDDARAAGIRDDDRWRWTQAVESKSSYGERGAGAWLYHYPDSLDASGRVVGGVPLSRALPDDAGVVARTERARAGAYKPWMGHGRVDTVNSDGGDDGRW